MAKIRHIAVLSEDPQKLSSFYQTTFGMREVSRGQMKEGRQAIFMSDGYINMAILPAHGRQEGINHFGFEVDSIEKTSHVALATGATQGPESLPRDGRFAEVFIQDPMGQRVDLSEQGWKT
jgi:catechol 2,3-dioxygenase-like lactoylglutathione lyase family enzyme